MARESRPAASAVRQHLVAAVQASATEHRGQRPPDALDVIVGVGDVRIAVVEPVPDPLAQLFPVGSVAPHALPAHLVEPLDADRLDLVLRRPNAEVLLDFLLDFDLDREAVGIPAGFAGDVIAPHRAVPAEEILHRSREHVVDAGSAVGGGRAFEEDELGLPLRLCEGLLEKILLFPAREHFLLEFVGRAIGRQQAEASALLVSPRRGRHGADRGHSLFDPEELEPAPRRVLATTCESDASTSDS